MQQATLSEAGFSEIEGSILVTTMSFMDRLDQIATQPVTTEADVVKAHDRFNDIISDMQAFSNSLKEGHQRGTTIGLGLSLGAAFFEVGQASSAQGTKGQAAAASA